MALVLPIKDPSLFFICRLCTKMAAQWEKGETVCHLKCGGPKKGMDFPLYQGPLPPATLAVNCFVCGQGATCKIKVTPAHTPFVLPRELGVCVKHLIHAGIDPKQIDKPQEIGAPAEKPKNTEGP